MNLIGRNRKHSDEDVTKQKKTDSKKKYRFLPKGLSKNENSTLSNVVSMYEPVFLADQPKQSGVVRRVTSVSSSIPEPLNLSDVQNSIDNDKGRPKDPPSGRTSATSKKSNLTQDDMETIKGTIENNLDEYIKSLAECVAIKSVASGPEYCKETKRITKWAATKLEPLGFEVQEINMEAKTLPNGRPLPAPQILLASNTSSAEKPTVLFYGYLDVYPATKSDGWLADPFCLTRSNERVYGRGVAAGKGPLLCWLQALEALKNVVDELPINMKFIIEVMHEKNSEGLKRTLEQNKDIFDNVDYILMTANSWLRSEKPCICYNQHGYIYFGVEVQGANKDLNSGLVGGTVYEAMNDLVYLMNQLVDSQNKILIPNINRNVEPISDNDSIIFQKVDFNIAEHKEKLNVQKVPHEKSKMDFLLHRWCYPSLSIHGIEGCYSDKGARAIIPGKATGKFSIRLVPNQDPEDVEKVVTEYLYEKWSERLTANSMNVKVLGSVKPTTNDPTNPFIEAVQNIMLNIFGAFPQVSGCIRCSGMPVAYMLKELSGKDVIFLPYTLLKDRHRDTNEGIAVHSYIRNMQFFTTLIYEIGNMPIKSESTEPLTTEEASQRPSTSKPKKEDGATP